MYCVKIRIKKESTLKNLLPGLESLRDIVKKVENREEVEYVDEILVLETDPLPFEPNESSLVPHPLTLEQPRVPDLYLGHEEALAIITQNN